MSKLTDCLGKFFKGLEPEGLQNGNFKLLYEGDSDYSHITITEENGVRTMYFGKGALEAETSIDIRNPDRAIFEYPGMMLGTLAFKPAGRNVLMLGLGGGILPMLFQEHLPHYKLTVVEIDPIVAELAETYFGFSAGGNMELVIGDGREFLTAQPNESYDHIWLDAFGGDYIPSHLTSLEFLRLCRERLKVNGVLVQNLHQSRPAAFQNQLKTTAEAFGSYCGFDGVRCGNAVIAACKPGESTEPLPTKKNLIKAAKLIGPRRVGPYDLVSEMDKLKNFKPGTNSMVLTDESRDSRQLKPM